MFTCHYFCLINPTWRTKSVVFTASEAVVKLHFQLHKLIFSLCKMFWYSNQDTLNKNNFLQILCDPGLITQDGTVAQVCSALPLSSKSSSTQQFRDTVETHTHFYYSLHSAWKDGGCLSFFFQFGKRGVHSCFFLKCLLISCGHSGIKYNQLLFLL